MADDKIQTSINDLQKEIENLKIVSQQYETEH